MLAGFSFRRKHADVNQFTRNGFLHLNPLDGSIFIRKVSSYVLLLKFIDISVFNANSVDLDQTLRRLICVYTDCRSFFYGTLGINGSRGLGSNRHGIFSDVYTTEKAFMTSSLFSWTPNLF